MAVCLSRGERNRDDEHVAPVARPTRFDDERRYFGPTVAKKHPPYVFGIRGVSCLVHKILRVELHWWRIADMETFVKMKRPVMIAQTCCAQSFRLDGDISRTCNVPNPDALVCGRCHGEGATFPKRGPAKISGLTRQEAHVKLGCVVNGILAMKNDLESITPILDTRPDVPTELQDRQFMRDRVEAYFRSHPGVIVTQEELERAGGGDAVRTRVSECKLKLGMQIRSVPTFLTDAAGKKHRLKQRYEFTPHTPLGRGGGEPKAQDTLFELR